MSLAISLSTASAASLTVADQPVRLIRSSTVYKAPAGVVLQNEDIIETGTSGAQIEATPSMVLALDPNTRIYLAAVGGRTEVVLLSGWVKLAAKDKAAVSVSSPVMRVSLENGSSIVHHGTDSSELFAENGAQSVASIDARGQAGTEVKVAHEQFASATAGLPPKVLARAPREFLRDLPLAFRDPVSAAPDRFKGVKVQPVVEREVDFGDVAPWLTSNFGNPVLRKRLITRFQGRLKDPQFRKQLEARLGSSAEWKNLTGTAPAAPVGTAPKAAPAAKPY